MSLKEINRLLELGQEMVDICDVKLILKAIEDVIREGQSEIVRNEKGITEKKNGIVDLVREK